jgi:poly-gamma-glutamate biosynthesis protein PgsC/CapC
MVESMTLSIGIGLILSVFMAEFFSLVAGGMVVPGYLAVLLNQPIRILEIFIIAILNWLIVSQVERITILFGRRRVTVTLLLGFILNLAFAIWVHPILNQAPILFNFFSNPISFSAFGYIIPGLISLWFDRQGILQTLSIITINMILIRLILMSFNISTIWFR